MHGWRAGRLAACSGALVLAAAGAQATPSTTYWTPMTIDFQAPGVLHIGVDNYFTVGKKAADGGGGFPTDFGLTLGAQPFSKLQIEFGVDHLGPADDPFYFNAKIGTPEGALFKGAPTIQAGIFNVGTKKDVTNQNVLYGVVGKTLPGIGRLSAGPYVGNGTVLRDGEGEKDNSGLMVAFDRGFAPVKTKDGDEYSRWVIAADYASGRNAIGGGGVGLYYYFSKSISLLVGPVWFNDTTVNGKWKWTIQLDVNHPRVFGR
jgi:hypothetical protein